MTIVQLAEMFDVTPNYLLNQWQRVVRSKEKQGIYLVKIGRGDSAEYGYRTLKDKEFIWEPKKEG